MSRCEDFPCCGHQIGECPTGQAKPCPECGRMFEPCSDGEIYCLACGSEPRTPKLSSGQYYPTVREGACSECGAKDVALLWAQTWRRWDGVCVDCVDEIMQAAHDDEMERR